MASRLVRHIYAEFPGPRLALFDQNNRRCPLNNLERSGSVCVIVQLFLELREQVIDEAIHVVVVLAISVNRRFLAFEEWYMSPGNPSG